MGLYGHFGTHKALSYRCGLCHIPFPTAAAKAKHLRLAHKASVFNTEAGYKYIIDETSPVAPFSITRRPGGA